MHIYDRDPPSPSRASQRAGLSVGMCAKLKQRYICIHIPSPLLTLPPLPPQSVQARGTLSRHVRQTQTGHPMQVRHSAPRLLSTFDHTLWRHRSAARLCATPCTLSSGAALSWSALPQRSHVGFPHRVVEASGRGGGGGGGVRWLVRASPRRRGAKWAHGVGATRRHAGRARRYIYIYMCVRVYIIT